MRNLKERGQTKSPEPPEGPPEIITEAGSPEPVTVDVPPEGQPEPVTRGVPPEGPPEPITKGL